MDVTRPSLSLLGVVGNYLNAKQQPRNVLLALPRMRGSHTAINIARALSHLLTRFNLQTRIGNLVTDNASKNRACIDILGIEYFFDASERHMLCMGHIVILTAQQVLFGSDVDAFEPELHTSVEELELSQWRSKGPIGRLHNLVKYITSSAKRREAFHDIQQA